MQPHDAGFIINFKHKYRKLLLHLVMRHVDDGQTASQIAEEVHVLEEITRPQTVYKSIVPRNHKDLGSKMCLYVLIMSHTRFRVNPPSIVAWMSRNSLLEAGTKSEV